MEKGKKPNKHDRREKSWSPSNEMAAIVSLSIQTGMNTKQIKTWTELEYLTYKGLMQDKNKYIK